MALYIATDEGDDNWTVYEFRWDPLDYMPVARKASGDSTLNRFQFYALLDYTWTVGEVLQLAEQGHDDLPWKSHGTIKAIVFDRATFSQGVPGLLMQPPLPPLATQ